MGSLWFWLRGYDSVVEFLEVSGNIYGVDVNVEVMRGGVTGEESEAIREDGCGEDGISIFHVRGLIFYSV